MDSICIIASINIISKNVNAYNDISINNDIVLTTVLSIMVL